MKKKYELIVVGGGYAGVGAAIEAARKGVDVLLIDKYNCLGGASSNCLVNPFMGYWSMDANTNKKKYLCGDIFLEIKQELKKNNGLKGESLFDEEIAKLILNRLCVKYGVTILFDTIVTDVTVLNGSIIALKAFGKSEVIELCADRYIDATGDGEVAMLSGCPFVLGRESDHLCQPMTLCFRIGGVDKEKYQANRSAMQTLYKEFQNKGLIKNPREDILVFDNLNEGVLHFNTTRIIKKNPTDPFDVTQAEIEAREQVFELYEFLKQNIEGFENSRILSTALQIGIRESRKIIGEYVLTVEDLKSLARFDDAIAVANYDIDIHNPEGTGTSHYYFKENEWYEIPYRSLLPKSVNNLLVTGRCISSTHEAQASYRIMPFCAELGQAAGAAASISIQDKTDFRNIDIHKVQRILRDEGFSIH